MDVRAGAFLTAAYISLNSPSLQPMNYIKGFSQSRQSADCLNDAYLHSLHTTIQTSIQNMTKIQKISLLSRSNCIIIMLFTVCFQDSKNYATLKLWCIQFLFDWSGQKLHWSNGPKTSLNQLSKAVNNKVLSEIYDAFTFFAVQYRGENFWFTTSSKLRMPFSRGLLVNFFRWVCAFKVTVYVSRALSYSHM